MFKPIYTPKGAAKEYGDYALNIYTGCPHKCYYCFAPTVLRKDREQFHSCVSPRDDIVGATIAQLKREGIEGKTIHLCFTCDPYPTGCDSSVTRKIIKAIKESGNHVQVLTKGDGTRDFDLLDSNDWYGITYAGYQGHSYKESYTPTEEPYSTNLRKRVLALRKAHEKGIKTWVSMEPVLSAKEALSFMQEIDYIDLWKVGKLNYRQSDIQWSDFGREAERILQSHGKNFYIKESLRKEIEKSEQ